jgi:hypothetical protein
MRTVARANFGVSAVTSRDGTVATPTRHFSNGRYLKCELHGQRYASSDEAFAAMTTRGYCEPFYSRKSVPNATFAKLKSERQACQFDALYRLYQHMGRRGQNRVQLRNRLQRLAKAVSIFHPVANAWKRRVA